MTKQEMIEVRTQQLLEQGWEQPHARDEAEKQYSHYSDEPVAETTKTKPMKRNK